MSIADSFDPFGGGLLQAKMATQYIQRDPVIDEQTQAECIARENIIRQKRIVIGVIEFAERLTIERELDPETAFRVADNFMKHAEARFNAVK